MAQPDTATAQASKDASNTIRDGGIDEFPSDRTKTLEQRIYCEVRTVKNGPFADPVRIDCGHRDNLGLTPRVVSLVPVMMRPAFRG